MKQIKTQPELARRPEPEKPEQACQQAQENQSNAAARPPQRAAPARRPLFGT